MVRIFLLFTCCLLGSAATAAEDKVALLPTEILLSGRISAVTNGKMTLDVRSFTQPSGKSSVLVPPKAKVVAADKSTRFMVRDKPGELLTQDEVRVGDFAQVYGLEKGAGQPFAARIVAVWSEEKDGEFVWSGATQGPSPPRAKETFTLPNELPQGDFEGTLSAKGTPAGWQSLNDNGLLFGQKGGNHWLVINQGAGPRNWVDTTIPVKPNWKTVRVSALARVKDLKRGNFWWYTARLTYDFLDENNRELEWGRGVNFYADCDWQRVARATRVPKGAVNLRVRLGFFVGTGVLAADDVRVEANAPIDTRTMAQSVEDGKFEKLDPAGWPNGFEPWDPNRIGRGDDQGHNCMTVTSPSAEISAGVNAHYFIPKEWKKLKVKVSMKGRGYVPGNQDWQRAAVGLAFLDEFGTGVGDVVNTPSLSVDNNWVTVEATNPVVKGAKVFRVFPSLVGSKGTVYFDDLEISDATNQELPSLPIEPGLPAGKFETLDVKGWPQGWSKGEGNLTLEAENGNHFLRLVNDEHRYLTCEARFKLPPEWKAITVSGRLRMKDYAIKPNAKEWETARVGFGFENDQGDRAGDFQPSLSIRADGDWKLVTVKVDIPRDAVYIKLSPLLHDTKGTFDVDDLNLEQAKPERTPLQFFDWSREFPEGGFEHVDVNGQPLNWPLPVGGRIVTEEGNKFLRLTAATTQSTLVAPSQWALKPDWKSVRVRARLRVRGTTSSGNPLDGARLQIIFLNGADAAVMPIPAPLETNKRGEWVDLQTKLTIPPGAVAIRLMPSLSRSGGTLDVDDVLIEPGD